MQLFWFIKIIAVITLPKILKKIQKMTVFNISETKWDPKNQASDSKSALRN